MDATRFGRREAVISVTLAAVLMVPACHPSPAATPTEPASLTVSPSPPTSPSPKPSPKPAYTATIQVLSAADRARMTGVSWHAGCPMALDDLREIHLTHWGMDGRIHRGVLVVAADAADAMVAVFHDLFDARFPIERMEPVDAYGGDDERSMQADNTSAFNCRDATGHPGTWSEHAYGRAIDVNPLRNPYVSESGVLPPQGAPYADRSRTDPGLIHAGDACVTAFAHAGWGWGGSWSSVKDYQHFSASGR